MAKRNAADDAANQDQENQETPVSEASLAEENLPTVTTRPVPVASDAPIVAQVLRASEVAARARPTPPHAPAAFTRAALEDAPILAAKPLINILVAAEHGAAKLHFSQNVHRQLQELGHPVTVTAGVDWRRIFADVTPEILLLDPGHNTVAARELCSQLKADSAAQHVLVAVVQPLTGNGAVSTPGLWASWQEAGADVLLDANTSSIALESMLEMWSRHARLHRDLLGLRETLGKQVQTDDLTQLLNRRYFFQAAHREVSRARRYNQPLSCLMVDINYFKLFNKTFGYGCGDYILRAVAATVRSWTRESDILARFGAKKFVILLPSTDIEGAMMLREKLQNEIGQFDFMWQDQKLPVTISIGEAERRREDPRTAERQYRTPAYEEDERSDIDETPLSVREELADLLEDADAALYVAKKGVRYPVIQPPASNTDEVVGILGSS